MKIILLIILTQVGLERPKEDVSKIRSFVTDETGHYMLTPNIAYHWSTGGTLLKSIPGYIVSLKRIGDTYYWTYDNWETGEVGVVIENGNNQTRWVNYHSTFFLMDEGQLYFSPVDWLANESILVPTEISAEGPEEVGKGYYSRKIIDPNFKRFWHVRDGDKVYIAEPTSRKIRVYQDNKEKEPVKIEIPGWIKYPGLLFETERQKVFQYYKGFTRIVGFGAISDGYMLAVEKTNMKTIVYRLSHEFKIIGEPVSLEGWGNRGQIFSGTDGARGWYFSPEPFTVKAIDP